MSIVVTIILSDIITVRERGTWQGYLNLIGAIGSTSGGPLGIKPLEALLSDGKLIYESTGGIIAQSTSWRW